MKKIGIIAAGVTAAILTATTAYAAITTTTENTIYDVNRNGIINSVDLTALMKVIAGADSSASYENCDITEDGSVNSKDLTRLMKYIASTPSDDIKTTVTESTTEPAETDTPVTDEPLTPEEEVAQLEAAHANALAVIADKLPGIVCWGDSLTSGPGGGAMSYPMALGNRVQSEIIDKYDPTANLSAEAKALVAGKDYSISIPVVNMGVGGETTNTILGRNGAVPFVTTSSLTIPAGKTAVQITFQSQNGRATDPLLQGNAGLEWVSIAGIEGTLSHYYGYTFTRSTAGEAVTVPAGTEIITAGSQNYRDYVTVIFIGQNGGYVGYDNLVEQQSAIFNHQLRNGDRHLIVGMHTTTPSLREDLEDIMVEAFGEKYFNLRKYMATDAIYEAGVTPTQEDLWRMQAGWTPFSLLESDELHFTPTGYEALGNQIFEELDRLGYFDEVREALGIE